MGALPFHGTVPPCVMPPLGWWHLNSKVQVCKPILIGKAHGTHQFTAMARVKYTLASPGNQAGRTPARNWRCGLGAIDKRAHGKLGMQMLWLLQTPFWRGAFKFAAAGPSHLQLRRLRPWLKSQGVQIAKRLGWQGWAIDAHFGGPARCQTKANSCHNVPDLSYYIFGIGHH